MQPTTRVQHGLTQALRQETAFGFSPLRAAHPTPGGFQADAEGGQTTLGRPRRRRAVPATRGLLRVDAQEARQATARPALRLIPATAGGPGLACQLCQPLLRGLAGPGVAHAAQGTARVEQEEGVARVPLLRAPGRVLLSLGRLRAGDGASGPLLHNRAGVGPACGRVAASRVAPSAAVRAGSHAWWARA
jgi:hypothetical protein